MNSIARLSRFGVAISLFTSGCSAEAETDRIEEVHQPIIGGSSEARDPAVVQILMRDAKNRSNVRSVCTGTVVSPQVVLTAAHCLDQKIAGTGEYGVFTGNDSNSSKQWRDPGRFVTAKKTILHPAWTGTTQPPATTHDLGVVVLEARCLGRSFANESRRRAR